MKVKSYLKLGLLAATVSLLISGCAGGASPSELVPKKYTVGNTKGSITLSEAECVISNGALVYKGKKLYDEEGDVIYTEKINGNVYYFIKKDTDLILKNLNKKIIKIFKNSYSNIITSQNDIMYIATTDRHTYKRSYRYNNLYSFNGKNVEIIGKNHPIRLTIKGNKITGGSVVGGYIIRWVKDHGSVAVHGKQNAHMAWTTIENMITRKVVDIKPSLVPHGGYTGVFGNKTGYDYLILGMIGNSIVYTYEYKYSDNGKTIEKTILEVQNLETKRATILNDNEDEKFKFYTNGNDVVFKSKNKLIDIRTQQNAKIDNNFDVLKIKNGSEKLSGRVAYYYMDNYSSKNIYYAKGRSPFIFEID
ncbi:MAG: hypothetical protein U9N59_00435 [Campylobacterota bacterium]|nr:hypothetical protein [Campylobacterota bacterium]